MAVWIEEKFCFNEGSESNQQQNIEYEINALAYVHAFQQTLLK
jgi:hypothetical protein